MIAAMKSINSTAVQQSNYKYSLVCPQRPAFVSFLK